VGASRRVGMKSSDQRCMSEGTLSGLAAVVAGAMESEVILNRRRFPPHCEVRDEWAAR